jgi:hypothetical protein
MFDVKPRLLSVVALVTLVACGGRTESRDVDCRRRKERPHAYTLPFWDESAESRARYHGKCSLACDHALCDEVFCCPTDFR